MPIKKTSARNTSTRPAAGTRGRTARPARQEVLKQEPVPNRVTINISTTPEQKDLIRKLAEKNKMSISRYIVTMSLGQTEGMKLVRVSKKVLSEQTGDKYTFGCSEEDCAEIKRLGRESGKTISRYVVEMCLLGELA